MNEDDRNIRDKKILARRAKGDTLEQIANDFDLTTGAIWSICNKNKIEEEPEEIKKNIQSENDFIISEYIGYLPSNQSASFNHVLNILSYHRPTRKYDKERTHQNELIHYLKSHIGNLNISSERNVMDGRIDILIELFDKTKIGIEVKRPKNSQEMDRLLGQVLGTYESSYKKDNIWNLIVVIYYFDDSSLRAEQVIKTANKLKEHGVPVIIYGQGFSKFN